MTPSKIPAPLNTDQSDDERFESQIREETELAKLNDLKEHYNNKALWAKWLLILLIGTLVLQWVFLVSVGRQWLDYTDYPLLLPAILLSLLVQVVGLAFIVVQSLFK